MMGPFLVELLPFNPMALVWIALLNPAVIGVALYMGARADQRVKIPLAGFIASIAGVALVGLAELTGVLHVEGAGGEVGLLVLGLGFGTVWAAIGYWWTRRRSS